VLVDDEDQVSDINLMEMYSSQKASPSRVTDEQCPPKDDWQRAVTTATTRKQCPPKDDWQPAMTTPTNRKRMHSSDAFVEKLFPKCSPESAVDNVLSTLKSGQKLSFDELLDEEEEDVQPDAEFSDPNYTTTVVPSNNSQNDFGKRSVPPEPIISRTGAPRIVLSPSKANTSAGDSDSSKKLSLKTQKLVDAGKENGARRRLLSATEAFEEIVSPEKKRNVFAVGSAKRTKFQLTGIKSSPPPQHTSVTAVASKAVAPPVEVKSRQVKHMMKYDISFMCHELITLICFMTKTSAVNLING